MIRNQGLIGLVTLVVLLTGLPVFWIMNTADAQADQVGDVQPVELSTLSAAMNELAAELRELRRTLPHGSENMAVRTVSCDAGPSAANASQSPEVVEEVMHPQTPHSAIPIPPVSSDQGQAFARNLWSVLEMPPQQVDQSHSFQSYQQVLDQFGQPSSMHLSPDGVLDWVYSDDATEKNVCFSFYDGFVIRTWRSEPHHDNEE